MEQKKKNKKNSVSSGIWTVIVLVALAAFRNADDPSAFMSVAAIIVALMAVVGVIAGIRKAKGKTGPGPARPAARAGADTIPYRPAAVPMYTTDGEGNTDRDRQRRREQLDTFLKNGIIDRKEYAALLMRHEGKR